MRKTVFIYILILVSFQSIKLSQNKLAPFANQLFYFCTRRKAFKPYSAQMAKLVDALVSGTSVSNDVQVRVLFWAQKTVQRRNG